MRAVLWHQGEADNLINTSTSSYVNDLKFVINQARQDYGRNMPWVVARVSYGDFIGGIDEAIIAAQNQVISSTPNVYAGPNSDVIQVPRKRPPLDDPEGLHFDYDGLVDIANAWNNSLTDSFFQSAAPISASPSPTVSIACASNNTLKLTVDGNYPTVVWESGETGSTITKGAGVYRAKIKDALGNTFYSGQVRVSDAPIASIVDNRLPSVCIGSSLSLTSNYDNVTWLNQLTNTTAATTRTFSTTTAGNYSFSFRDVSGCDFVSNTLNVTVNPLPATPTIANEKSTTFCQGDNTTLRASSDNVQYNWSDGQKNKVVTIGHLALIF
ncbi:sialate O-acetylesterase [Spirosoma telluris]|uniref:sialate O-acetylesterase n=1 Tax=Spirosoma telluris TaxID=2183553 RepID=UPI002FC3AF4E